MTHSMPQVKAAFLAGLAVVLLLAAATRWLGKRIEACATAQMACKVLRAWSLVTHALGDMAAPAQ